MIRREEVEELHKKLKDSKRTSNPHSMWKWPFPRKRKVIFSTRVIWSEKQPSSCMKTLINARPPRSPGRPSRASSAAPSSSAFRRIMANSNWGIHRWSGPQTHHHAVHGRQRRSCAERTISRREEYARHADESRCRFDAGSDDLEPGNRHRQVEIWWCRTR